MARVTTQKARKPYKCDKCGAAIAVGDEYRKAIIKTGPTSSRTLIRCNSGKCYPKQSELTTQETLGEAYRIQESMQSIFDADPFDARSAADDLESCKDDIESLTSEVQDKISNLESAFSGGCPAIDTLQEYAEQLETWTSEVETAIDEIRAVLEENPAPETGEAGSEAALVETPAVAEGTEVEQAPPVVNAGLTEEQIEEIQNHVQAAIDACEL